MNNTVKIALALAAGSSLLYMGLRKKNKKKKVYLAPDGNTYQENQMYRTYDNKLYKNGKEYHYNLPKLNDELYSFSRDYKKVNTFINFNHSEVPKDIQYHHKGIRHH